MQPAVQQQRASEHVNMLIVLLPKLPTVVATAASAVVCLKLLSHAMACARKHISRAQHNPKFIRQLITVHAAAAHDRQPAVCVCACACALAMLCSTSTHAARGLTLTVTHSRWRCAMRGASDVRCVRARALVARMLKHYYAQHTYIQHYIQYTLTPSWA